MLLYIKDDNKIINLDNVVMIKKSSENLMFTNKDILAYAPDRNFHICRCDSEEMANKIINDIYTKMTYGSENMIIDIEDYRDHCEDCIKFKTDACAMGTNMDPKDTTCISFLGEEAEEDVNEEK